jgi:hypothetical protein
VARVRARARVERRTWQEQESESEGRAGDVVKARTIQYSPPVSGVCVSSPPPLCSECVSRSLVFLHLVCLK